MTAAKELALQEIYVTKSNPVSFSLVRATHCCWRQEQPVLLMWSGLIFNGITVYIKCIRIIFILSRCTTWSFAIPQKVLISNLSFWSEEDLSHSEYVLYLLVDRCGICNVVLGGLVILA